jgi:hypothetical protein
MVKQTCAIIIMSLCLILASPVFSQGTSSRETIWNCPVAQEYITVYRYLGEQKLIEVSDNRRRDIAAEVAEGCFQAAWRFIKTMKTVAQADIDPRHGLRLALEMSRQSDERVRAFLTIFKLAYSAKYLDQTLFQSLQMARQLSLEAENFPYWLESDFRELLRFCLQGERLDLPRPQCGQWTVKLIQMVAHKSEHGQALGIGVATPFMTGFEFLTVKEGGPRLTTADAVALLEKLIAVSPYAVKSFEQAFEFAVDDEGLKLDRVQAIKFAQKLAAKVAQKGPSEKALSSRTPKNTSSSSSSGPADDAPDVP